MDGRPQLLVVVLAILLVVGSFSFAISATGETPNPVAFEGTNEGGLAFGAVYHAQQTDAVIPRAEAFYAQYQYVVGYDGIAFLIDDLHASARSREFGRVLTVYVSDFTNTGVSLDQNGTLIASPQQDIGWTTARDAYFVVDSRARTVGETRAIVPFSDRRSARSFAHRYDGTVVRWRTLKQRRYEDLKRTQQDWQRTISRRQQWANRTASRARSLRNRSVSVVVGQQASNLSAAVAQAPPNTTVRIPPGTYNVTDLRVDKPLTIEGAGPNTTVVSGDGVGSVINITHRRVGVRGLRITGVGTNTSTGKTLVSPNSTYYKIRRTYGRGASGIVFSRAPRSLVTRVTIETPTNGLLVRDSPKTVITNTTVYAPPEAENTSLALSVMSSRVLVQDSALYGGFHSFIVHNTTGLVARNIHAEGATTGFHGLYTRRALVFNSTFRDMFKPVMTATEGSGNIASKNSIRNSVLGVDFAGSRSYVARNTIAHNQIGIIIEGRGTLYTDNVFGYNHVGAQVAGPFPTNRITGNDFVGNDQPVTANNENVLYVWTDDGRGNYWRGFDRFDRDDDGTLDGSIRPTTTAGQLEYSAPGGATLARSGAVTLLRTLQTLVPGLQAGGVIDVAPLAEPNSPQRIATLDATYSAGGPYRPASDPNPYDYHASYDIPHSANNTFG